MKRRILAPCSVYIDTGVMKGTVELSEDYFKASGVEPGKHIILNRKRSPLRVLTRMSESLGSCEIAVDPILAFYLGLHEGDKIEVEDRLIVGDGSWDHIDTFSEVLERPCDHLKGMLGSDLERFKGMTVEQVLQHMVRYGEGAEGVSLVVAPNTEGVGIPRGEACADPSLDVVEWDPTDGTGVAKTFDPEGSPDDEVQRGHRDRATPSRIP